jgi:hypothetical protein
MSPYDESMTDEPARPLSKHDLVCAAYHKLINRLDVDGYPLAKLEAGKLTLRSTVVLRRWLRWTVLWTAAA